MVDLEKFRAQLASQHFRALQPRHVVKVRVSTHDESRRRQIRRRTDIGAGQKLGKVPLNSLTSTRPPLVYWSLTHWWPFSPPGMLQDQMPWNILKAMGALLIRVHSLNFLCPGPMTKRDGTRPGSPPRSNFSTTPSEPQCASFSSRSWRAPHSVPTAPTPNSACVDAREL